MSSNRGNQHRRRIQLSFNESTLGLVGLAVLLVGLVFWTAGGANTEKTDFAMDYVGARMVHDGLGRWLYDTTLQVRIRDSVFQNASPLYFEHPPFEALLLSPLANLRFRTAYLIWGLTNVSILMVLMIWLRQLLPWPRENLAYITLWLIFAPLLVSLYQGQSSVVVLAAYSITYAHLRRRNFLLAGLALGLGLFKFQFVIPFAAIFLLCRRWRFCAGFAFSCVVSAILSLFATGWRGITEYARFLLRISAQPQDLSYGSALDMPTIYGVVHATFRGDLSLTNLNIAVALLSLSLLSLVAWVWSNAKCDSAFVFAAGVASSLLCGSHMFTQDFSPLLLAMLLSGAALRFTQSGIRNFVLLLLTIFWAFPVYFLCVRWHCMYILAFLLLSFAGLCMKLAQDLDVNGIRPAHLATAN